MKRQNEDARNIGIAIKLRLPIPTS